MTVSAISHYRGGTIDVVAPLAKNRWNSACIASNWQSQTPGGTPTQTKPWNRAERFGVPLFAKALRALYLVSGFLRVNEKD